MRRFSSRDGVLLILSLIVTFMLLPPSSKLLAETTDSESVAGDFMALSGLDHQIQQMPRWYATLVDQIFVGLEQGGQRVPGKTKRMVRQSFLDALDAESLQGEIRHRLDKDLPEQVANPTLDWLRSDLGRRITDLENRAKSPEAALQQAAFTLQLQIEPPSAERMQLVRRLEDATGGSDHAVDGWETVAVTLGAVMTAGMADGPQRAKDIVREKLAKLRPDVKTLFRQASLRHMLFMYRTLTDEELSRYAEFLESETGKELTRIVNEVLTHVTTGAIERMEALLTDSLARDHQKAGI
jgi:hypothetical protein